MTTHTLRMRRRPLLVEVVGPAGAGKTTLLRALCQHDPQIRAVLGLRRLRYMPFVAGHTVLLLPTILRRYRNRKEFSWREIRMMVRLQTMHHVLGSNALNNSAVTLVDQGPVYTLARLHEYGFEDVNSQQLTQWWDRVFTQWASTLDLIIWLDAPDAILAERIDTRNKWHAVKGRPEQETYRFLARFRTSYEQVIAKLTTQGGPRVLCFKTDQAAPDQITHQVLAAFRSNIASNR
jgi:deoxyadenosine/deoxycytidine kinase